MRIFEITDRNILWNKLSNIDANFEEEYQQITKAVNLVIRLKHRSKYPIVINMIESFSIRIDKVLNAAYPDPTDPDILSLKTKLKSMRNNVTELQKHLSS